MEELDIYPVVTREREGGFSVRVPEVAGVITEGETIQEVIANVQEATEGVLEALSAEERQQALRRIRERHQNDLRQVEQGKKVQYVVPVPLKSAA